MLKKYLSLALTAIMTINMTAAPVYAIDWNFGNIIDDIVDTVEKGADEVVDTVKKGADWVDGATDDTMNWVNGASEDTQQWLSTASDDTVNWINTASDDTRGWVNGASDDTRNWLDGASDDTLDWVDGASNDTLDWLDGASEDTLNWIDGASEDTLDWLDTASEDTLDWLDTATDDVGGFLQGLSSGIKSYRRPDKPSINGTFAQMEDVLVQEAISASYTNVMDHEMGTFSEMENIKERRLPQVAQDKIKSKLMELGLSEYWSNFAVGKISNSSENTSVGAVIESVIPFDFLLNGMVANEIDAIVEKYGFEDIDLTQEIQPDSPIQGLKFKYTADKIKDLDAPSFVIFRGITSIGFRDTVKAEIISGGVSYPAVAFEKDKRLGFYAKVDRLEDLSIVVTNTFDRPSNIPLDIAEGLQKVVNDLAPFGKPISDKATKDIAEFLGDNETLYKETTRDKKGNKKHEVKKMPSLNEIYANGDVGKIVATTLYTVPIFGDILAFLFKSTGNDATLENIVRDIINQKEVKTFISIENPEFLVLADLNVGRENSAGGDIQAVTLDVPTAKIERTQPAVTGQTDAETGREIGTDTMDAGDGLTSEFSHEFDSYPAMTQHFGSYTLNRAYDHSIYATSPINSDMLMTFNDLGFADGKVETIVTVYDPVSGLENYAGLAFRVSDVIIGSRMFSGYSAVLMPSTSRNDAQVILYKHTGGSKEILDSEMFDLSLREAYTLTVRAEGRKLNVYVNGSKVLSANDDTYLSGGVGFTSSAVPAIYQNIEVSE